MVKRTMISQLASVSEGALGKLTGADGAMKALQTALHLKERVERTVNDVTSLNDRVEALEKRVAELEKATKPKSAAPARKRAASSAGRGQSRAAGSKGKSAAKSATRKPRSS